MSLDTKFKKFVIAVIVFAMFYRFLIQPYASGWVEAILALLVGVFCVWMVNL